MAMLDARGLFPLALPRPRQTAQGRRGAVRSRSLATFYAQLADLLHSGVPLLRSLDILERQSSQPALSEVLREVRARVADGTGLAEAMAQHPARLQRTGRQHGPRRPGRRLPRRRAPPHRRLHRAAGRPQGQGDRRPGLPGLPGRRRLHHPQRPRHLLRAQVRADLQEAGRRRANCRRSRSASSASATSCRAGAGLVGRWASPG